MADLTLLTPGDVLAHRSYPEYTARVIEIGVRVETVLLSPRDQLGDRASLDRVDVEKFWDVAR
jgi:hypothetical protein